MNHRRAIVFVQCLALGAHACTQTRDPSNNTSSGGESTQQNTIAPDASLLEVQVIAIETPSETPNNTVQIVTVARGDGTTANTVPPPPPPLPGSTCVGTIAPQAQCSHRSPDGQRCASAGLFCGGSASHCVGGGPRVPPRCSGEEWRCQCNNIDGCLRWRCEEHFHPAGPLPPPELPLV